MPNVRTWSRVSLWVACLFAVLLVALSVNSPADAQEVGPSGSFQASYPIKVPSYHGLEPSLGLTYNSSARNGLVGVGWELSGFSSIQRASPGAGTPNYAGSDVFFLDGMQLIQCERDKDTGEWLTKSPSCKYSLDDTGLKAYATETETFQRIAFESATDSWYVWNKDGSKLTYEPGVKTDSGTFDWDLTSVEDTLGNETIYRYCTFDNEISYQDCGTSTAPKVGERYIDTITYNGTTIKFYWQERPDTITYATGRDLTTMRYRLKTIDVTVEGQRARAYKLSYVKRDTSASRSLLDGLREYGKDANVCDETSETGCPPDAVTGDITGGTALPATTAGWPEDNDTANAWQGSTDPPVAWASHGTDAGKLIEDELGPWDPRPFNGTSRRWLAGDLNGDGREDWVGIDSPQSASTWENEVTLSTAIARQDGSYTKQQSTWPLSRQFTNESAFWSIGDPDGDGDGDIMGAVSDIFVTFRLTDNGTFRKEELPSGLQAGGTRIISNTFVLGPTGGPTYGVWNDVEATATAHWMVADVNGDARSDFMVAYHQSDNTVGLCTALSKSGGFGAPTCQNDTGWEWYDTNVKRNRFFATDVNGDGKSDFTMVSPQSRFDVALSDGDGTFTLTFDESHSWPWQDDDVWFPGDVNNDGNTDLMQVIKSGSGGGARASLRSWVSSGTGKSFSPGKVVPTNYRWYLNDPCLGTPTQAAWFPGDADGDGLEDFMHLTAQPPSSCELGSPVERPIGIAAALTRSPLVGRYDLSEVRWIRGWVPGNQIGFVPADADGDGATDLLFAQAELCFPNDDGTSTGRCTPYDPISICIPGTQICVGKPFSRWKLFTQLSPSSDRNPERWQTADVSGDGRDDLVYVSHLDHNVQIQTVLSNSTGSVTKEIDLDLPEAQWQLGDVNGDGRNDLIYVNYEVTCHHGTVGGSKGFLGRTCFKVSSSSGIRVYTLISKGDGSWRSPTVNPSPTSNPIKDPEENIRQWRVADANGDGKADLVRVFLEETPQSPQATLWISTLVSNGEEGFGSTLKYQPIIRSQPLSFPLFDTLNWKLADTNADAKIDLVHQSFERLGGDTPSVKVHTLSSQSDGSWSLLASGKTVPLPAGFSSSDSLGWNVMDVNGDSTSDLVHLEYIGTEYVIDALLSAGSDAWVHVRDSVAWGTPADTTGLWRDTQNWKPVDTNADGRMDLAHVHVNHPKCRDVDGRILCTGTTSGRVDTFQSNGDGTWEAMPQADPLPGSAYGSSSHWRSVEVNGDGKGDLIRIGGGGEQIVATSLLSTRPLDLMSRISNGMGSETTVDYTPSSHWVPWNDPRPGCYLPAGVVLQHVSSVTTQEGHFDTSDNVGYDYGCPRWSYAKRSFLGYEFVASTHAETLNSPKRAAVARYKISDECGARIGVSEERSADHSILTRTETYYQDDPGWDHNSIGPPPYRCLQEASVEYQCDAGTRFVEDSVCVASRTEFSYDKENGNINETRECSYEGFDYTYDTVAPKCESTSPNEQERTTLTEYKPATGPYIVGLPSREAVFEGLGYEGKQPVSNTRYCYDDDLSQSCEATPSRGLLTAMKEWDNEDQRYLTTNYKYDDFGNQTSVEDANGHCCTTAEFDNTYHLFPVKICNALDQCTEQKWDPAIQQVVKSTDANGYSTNLNYDELGRPTQTCYPDGGVRQLSYPNWGDPEEQRVREYMVEELVPSCKKVDEDDLDGLWTETYVDGFGRAYRVVKEGAKPGVTFAQDTLYGDSSPQVHKQSHWYTMGSEEPRYEEFHYDEAGRPTRQVHPDENRTELTWEYGEEGTRTWVTSRDELGNEKTVYNDVLGRTVQVREVNRDDPEDPNYDTYYEYDVLDNTKKVIDDKGNVTTMTWDSLGRQLSVDDPDMGLWTYDYDDVGNSTKVTDAENHTTESHYDEINRLEKKVLPSGETTTWRYDEPGHGAGIGRLTSISDPSGSFCANALSEQMSYDKMGRVSSSTKCVLGREYTTSTGYNLLGQQAWVRYPDDEQVNYHYDTAGRLQSMSGYVNSFLYDAAGHLTHMELANGTEENFHYNSDREWPASTSVLRDGDTLFQARYTYKPNGLVESSSSSTLSANNDMDLTFAYDGLNRLAKVTGDLQQSFDYDSIGNMTKNSSLGNYEYRPSGVDGCGAGGTNAGPHAVCQAGPREYEYDANGNMTLRDGEQILWNEDNQPEWIEQGKGKWMHYLYDAGGDRVLSEPTNKPRTGTHKQSNGTYYHSPLLSYSASGRSRGLTKYYYAGPMLVARKNSDDTYWFHHDTLGSTRLITGQNAGVVQSYYYEPFGQGTADQPAVKTFTNDIQFTGQRTDVETNLIHMGARSYDPQLARFLSPDSFVPEEFNPQALNRYSYAYDNPLSYTDPTGHYSVEQFGSDVGIGLKNLGLGLLEPGLIVADFGQMGAALIAHEFFPEYAHDVQWLSAMGSHLEQNPSVYEGLTVASEMTANVGTAGASGLADNIARVFAEDMSANEAQSFLVQGAVGQVGSAALGVGISKATGSGWTGQGPAPNPAVEQGMMKNVSEARVVAGKVDRKGGHATFGQGRDASGNLTAVKESIPGGGPEGHAEPQVMSELPSSGGRTLVVEQIPCDSCSRILTGVPEGQPGLLGGSITGSLRVVVPKNPANMASGPKGVAMKAARGEVSPVMQEVLTVPFEPPVVPFQAGSYPKSRGDVIMTYETPEWLYSCPPLSSCP